MEAQTLTERDNAHRTLIYELVAKTRKFLQESGLSDRKDFNVDSFNSTVTVKLDSAYEIGNYRPSLFNQFFKETGVELVMNKVQLHVVVEKVKEKVKKRK
jgi:hypothetical protein